MDINDVLEPGYDRRWGLLLLDAGAEVTARPGHVAAALKKWARVNDWPRDWTRRRLWVGYFELRDANGVRVPMSRWLLTQEINGGDLLDLLAFAEREGVAQAVLNDVKLQGVES